MKLVEGFYEGKKILEEHGYICELDGTNAVVKTSDFDPTVGEGVLYSLDVGDKDPELGFHHIALFFAGAGEPFSGWSEGLPVVVETEAGYAFWGDIYGQA